MSEPLMFALASGVLAILYGAWSVRWILAQPEGNERMREIFFAVAENPKATITAKLDPKAFAGMAVGQSLTRPLKANVTIKGASVDIDTEVLVTRVGADRVTVVPTAPVIVSTDMFGLTDELGELRALAQLPSITPAVPVTFSLSFTRS